MKISERVHFMKFNPDKQVERNSISYVHSVRSVLRKAALGTAVALAMSTASSNVAADDHIVNVKIIDGHVVTGFNRFLSAPVWDLGPGAGGLGFSFLFSYEEGAAKPAALTAASPMNTMLATGFDEELFGDIAPPELLNIPLHDVPRIADDGSRVRVKKATDTLPFELARSLPNDSITLGDWMKGEGKMTLTCFEDGTGSVEIDADGLIPNGVYTLWGIFWRDFSGDGNFDGMAPSPLGGVPNVTVADLDGSAKIFRNLNYCPQNEPSLVTSALAYHSDGNVYGGAPEILMPPGVVSGMISHEHVAWGINVQGPLIGSYIADALEQ